MSMERREIFICYSRQDEVFLEELKRHLKVLTLDGLKFWDDTDIKPGEQWQREIAAALNRAKVAILLVSPDFNGSEFIRKVELPTLLRAQQTDGLTVLPILVRPVDRALLERTGLDQFQFANDLSQALGGTPNHARDLVLQRVTARVQELLTRP